MGLETYPPTHTQVTATKEKKAVRLKESKRRGERGRVGHVVKAGMMDGNIIPQNCF